MSKEKRQRRAILILPLLAILMNVGTTTYRKSFVGGCKDNRANFLSTASPETKVTKNNISESSHNNKVTTACPLRQQECPTFPSYVDACKMTASRNVEVRGPKFNHSGLTVAMIQETVGDTHVPLSRLQDMLHNRRLIFFGDSVARQWFETLSCRLGLESPRWFHLRNGTNFCSNSDPSRRLELLCQPNDGLHIRPLNVAPWGFTNASGYSIAKTPSTNSRCFNTTLEYIKMDGLHPRWFSAAGLASAVNNLATNGLEDVVMVFNLGVHNKNLTSFRADLISVLQSCGSVNKQRNQINSKKSTNKHEAFCFYRETLPQHFIPKHGMTFPEGWVYNNTQTQHICGPFQPNVNVVYKEEMNQLSKLSETYQVPIIKGFHVFEDAWNWHFGGDCTHFCHDSILWDLVNLQLLETWDSVHPPFPDSIKKRAVENELSGGI